MSANLSQNIKNALNNQNVKKFYAWSDSTVVLHWLKEKDCKNWPEQPDITNNDESEIEKKNGQRITSYYR